MSGTLQSIARLIRDGDLALAECPTRLGITREQLENRLRLMERQGYILRQAVMPESSPCSCGHCCGSCRTSDCGQIPVTIRLTGKGVRLAGGRSGDSWEVPDQTPIPVIAPRIA